MYSHEIKQLLELKNYLLDRQETNKVLNVKDSPQINHIKYENDEFEMWTSDNYYFKFKIKRMVR